MYKLSALKAYQYVIDLQPELIHVCNLAIGTVHMSKFKAMACFAGNLSSGFEIVACISI